MNINSAFPSKYIKASDLNGSSVKVTIREVRMEDLGDESKPVAYFENKSKGLVLNITNSRLIAERLGGETDDWIGKDIEIYADKVPFQGRIVDAVRVRPPLPPAAEVEDEDSAF